MKIIRLLLIASCFALLPSCSVLGSLLKIPTSILKTAGRTVGFGLTDDAAQPVTEESSETIEKAAAQRKQVSE